MQVQLQPEFDEILQPLGSHALEFFLAASLYHARKISFASAAHMSGLDFDAFKTAYRSILNKAMSSLMNAFWKIYTL